MSKLQWLVSRWRWAANRRRRRPIAGRSGRPRRIVIAERSARYGRANHARNSSSGTPITFPWREVHGCRRQRVWQAPVNLWEAPFCSVLFRLACRPTLQRYRSGHEWGANGTRFGHGGAQMGHVPRTEVRGCGPMTKAFARGGVSHRVSVCLVQLCVEPAARLRR